MTLPVTILPAHRGVLAALSARQCCTAAALAADTGHSVQQVAGPCERRPTWKYVVRS